MACLSAACWAGIDLGSAIRPLGGDRYAVRIDGKEEVVTFDRNPTAQDPLPREDTPQEFWPVLFQRAYLQRWKVDSSHPDSSRWVTVRDGKPTSPDDQEWQDCKVALRAVTGRPTVSFEPTDLVADARLRAALAARRPVVAGTFGKGKKKVVGGVLVQNHAYAVLSASDAGVELRNPWGTDAGFEPLQHPHLRVVKEGDKARIEPKPESRNASNLADVWDMKLWKFKPGLTDRRDDNPLDGLIRVTWDEFRTHFSHVTTTQP